MISLVVIGRNEAQNLKRCFESIDKEQFKEVIYVDSSSLDESIKIVEDNFSFVKIIRLKSNYYSASLARFVGLKYINSEYVQFLDGDMTLDKNWIQKSYSFLLENKNVAIVHGYKFEYKDKNDLTKYKVKKDKASFQSDYLQGSYLARTHILKKSGFLDIRMTGEEERDLYVRIRNLGYQVWYLDYMMASHYDFKSRGFRYVLFSPISVVILLPFSKYIKSKLVFDYLYVYRYLLPQLIIDIFTFYSLISFSKNLIIFSIVLQSISLFFYYGINRKGYWLIWKSAFMNFFRFFSLLNKQIIYSHSRKY